MHLTTHETSAAELTRVLEAYFAQHPQGAVIEDGRVLFDMGSAKYALSSEYERCVLHLWSEERNLVRTVVGVDPKHEVLRLHVRRFGQAKPQLLQIVPNRDQRTPATRTAARTKYLHMLERVLGRSFPDFDIDGMRNAMDLEHSFGPAYARGTLVRGGVGVGSDRRRRRRDAAHH